MTILFSFINDKQAAVASDGNAVRNSDDMIVDNNKDKTFHLCDRMIVGAFSNNMSLDHKIYGQNVDIGTILLNISKNIHMQPSFQGFVDNLIRSYQDTLNSKDTYGPEISNRSSNILLAASRYFDGKLFEIFCLRFTYETVANKISLFKKEGPFSGAGTWYVDPPDGEIQSISNAIKNDFNTLPSGLTIDQVAKRGIEIGVTTSKINKANGKFLGGKIFTRSTLL